jgi:hypothetical protein
MQTDAKKDPSTNELEVSSSYFLKNQNQEKEGLK